MATSPDVERYRADPIAFIKDFLRDPETGKPFVLYPAEELFLSTALTLTPEGTLPYAELLFAAIKKSGKTMVAAWAVLYVVLVIGGPYAEGYILSNDLEQAVGRVFEAIVKLIRANPALRKQAKITERKITFPATGATITALASDYAGSAGAAPSITVFDELWAYSSERAHRLWDEMIPTPTRKVSVRLTVSYAGFENEGDVLQGLYNRGLAGQEIGPSLYRTDDGLLMAWHHTPIAPWQTDAWLKQMRAQLRPNAYLRMIENRFVSGEESFIPIEWWDGVATAQPVLASRNLRIVLGVDAGLKHDSTAIVAVAWDQALKRPRIVSHRIFTPRPGETLDIEATVERVILEFFRRFSVVEVRYDPWQLQRSAQGLRTQGVTMTEFPQTSGNLTAMTSNLFEALKGAQIIAYPDDEIRLALQRAVIIEGSRGARIGKEKSSHRVDVVVALAMASLGAVEVLAGGWEPWTPVVQAVHRGVDGVKKFLGDASGLLAPDSSASKAVPAPAAPVNPQGIVSHAGVPGAVDHPVGASCGICIADAQHDPSAISLSNVPVVAVAGDVIDIAKRRRHVGVDPHEYLYDSDSPEQCPSCGFPRPGGHTSDCPELTSIGGVFDHSWEDLRPDLRHENWVKRQGGR